MNEADQYHRSPCVVVEGEAGEDMTLKYDLPLHV